MPYSLYRLYGEEETLLYVGMSMNLPARLTNHRVQKEWWTAVHHIGVEHFDSRRKVLDAEREAIQSEHPLWNIQHRVGPPSEPPTPHQEAIELLFGLAPELGDPVRRRELSGEFDEHHEEDEHEDGSPVDYSHWPADLKALTHALVLLVDDRWLNGDAIRRALSVATEDNPASALAEAREVFAVHNPGWAATDMAVERFALVQSVRRLAREVRPEPSASDVWGS